MGHDVKCHNLEFLDVTVAYGRRPVLWNIDLSIDGPGLFGVIGPNGAGKSTLVKAALGLVPLVGGSVRLFGLPLEHVRPLRSGLVPGIARVANGGVCESRFHFAVARERPACRDLPPGGGCPRRAYDPVRSSVAPSRQVLRLQCVLARLWQACRCQPRAAGERARRMPGLPRGCQSRTARPCIHWPSRTIEL